MIDCVIENQIACITLNRAPVNAFNAEGLIELKRRVLELNGNAGVRAIVITGQGEKFFSAGADLASFASGDKAAARAMARHFGEAFEALQESRPVVIAAINGYAMGGGLECALSCDIRIAEEHAVMALPEPAVGLLPAGCGTQTLPWLVGEGWAKRMILTGERVSADVALRIGLVEEVVTKGGAFKAALEMAGRVGKLSPGAVSSCKRLIHSAREGIPRHAALALERERFLDLFDQDDQIEGVTAFLEKRPAVWKGN
jgi:enoyl-CoA hydratase/carnithine racemase